MENHLTTCGHVYESCQLLCGVVTTRDEMGRHVREECSQREEACLHCSGVHKVCEMVEHVKVCGKVEVLCELGCGTRVRRESILFHLSSECSEESVVCPYEKYRCEVVGLKRRELKQHLEENRCLHTELKFTALEKKFEESQLSFTTFDEKFMNSMKKNELHYVKSWITVCTTKKLYTLACSLWILLHAPVPDTGFITTSILLFLNGSTTSTSPSTS